MRDRMFLLDINKKMYETPCYKQFDNDILFRIKIIENGVNADLTGYTIKAFFNNKSEIIQKNCTIKESIVETKLDNNILKNVGEVDVEFCLIKGEVILTTFTIVLKVEKSINRNEAVEKEPSWDIIKDFQTTLDNAVKKANEDIQKTIDKAETNIESTINQAETDISNTIIKVKADIQSTIKKAQADVDLAINNIPPKSELIGPKGVSMRLKGAWSSSEAYVNDGNYIDLVTSEGNTYACKKSNTNQAVTNTTYWELIVQKGDKGNTGGTGPQGPPGESYTHPSNHPATMITEDATHRFVTDTEKSTWNDKASTAVVTSSANGLMSSTDKKKLDGIASNANNYVHPSTHPATMINQDATHRFVTDTEKNSWNGKANANHSHSYLPLSGGTVNGTLIVVTLKPERLTGKSGNNIYLGSGAGGCRAECDTLIRFYTSWVGSKDCGLYINPDGSTGIRSNDIVKHMFNANGSKTGGSMEVDGTVYGMSPTDSPQTLIEYIEYDINVEGQTKIQLDPIYSKMISKYAVFSSNSDIKIVSKEKNYFIVEGNGIVDFEIKGQRKNEEEYFRIMGGLEHGVNENETI